MEWHMPRAFLVCGLGKIVSISMDFVCLALPWLVLVDGFFANNDMLAVLEGSARVMNREKVR
jgi:hypothetical protein